MKEQMLLSKLYKKVEISREPKVTGIRDGSFQVESKWIKSFRNKEERKYYCDVLNAFYDQYRFDRFPIRIDTEQLHLPITFYADKKSVKETDFVAFAFYVRAIQLMVSEVTLHHIKSFHLPSTIELECRIFSKKPETFQGKYFLLGFPYIDNHLVDYAKSSFDYLHPAMGCIGEWREMPSVISQEEYFDFKFRDESGVPTLTRPKHIVLKGNDEFDVINTRFHGLFFSQNLIDELQESNHSNGLEEQNCTLCCEI